MRLHGHTDQVNALIVMKNGNLVSGSSDCTARIWDMSSGACLYTLSHDSAILSLAVLGNGSVATGSGARFARVTIWDPDDGGVRVLDTHHCIKVIVLAVLDNGMLVSGSDNGCVVVWDTRSGVNTMELAGDYNKVTSMVGLGCGRLVIGSDDAMICILK